VNNLLAGLGLGALSAIVSRGDYRGPEEGWDPLIYGGWDPFSAPRNSYVREQAKKGLPLPPATFGPRDTAHRLMHEWWQYLKYVSDRCAFINNRDEFCIQSIAADEFDHQLMLEFEDYARRARERWERSSHQYRKGKKGKVPFDDRLKAYRWARAERDRIYDDPMESLWRQGDDRWDPKYALPTDDGHVDATY